MCLKQLSYLSMTVRRVTKLRNKIYDQVPITFQPWNMVILNPLNQNGNSQIHLVTYV